MPLQFWYSADPSASSSSSSSGSSSSSTSHPIRYGPGRGSLFEFGKCGLPAVAAISDLPFIDDCGIPSAPTIIQDCPDVDIPLPGLPGGNGISGVGDTGPPGDDGYNCVPTVQIVLTKNTTKQPANVAATLYVTQIGACSWRLNLAITFYKPYDTETCVFWVWCCTMPGCTDGHWVRMEGSSEDEDILPPTFDGTLYGETEIRCPEACVSGSSSSSSSDVGQCCGYDIGESQPATLTFSVISVVGDGLPDQCCVGCWDGAVITLSEVGMAQWQGTLDVNCGIDNDNTTLAVSVECLSPGGFSVTMSMSSGGLGCNELTDATLDSEQCEPVALFGTFNCGTNGTGEFQVTE